jgi:hypothetical protein
MRRFVRGFFKPPHHCFFPCTTRLNAQSLLLPQRYLQLVVVLEIALHHILWGDTAIRPVRDQAGRKQEVALSGGLHTWDGWQKFVSRHPKMVHLLQFRCDLHDDWFYARELQNGVITLKIPRQLYTNSAASITKQPDYYYKSGYLWKTLYPASYTEETILQVIGEALRNIDAEDSTPPTAEKPLGVVYGYANVHEPLRAIKLRIQLEGHQIKSAFPAWEQPSTGNNGKPYSHESSISYLIAASTVESSRFRLVYGPAFRGSTFNMQGLIAETPPFVLTRSRRDMAVAVDAWRAIRRTELEQVAALATPSDLDRIESYLSDYVCAKDPFYVQRGLYANFLALIDAEPQIFNAAQLTENVGECIEVLALCDQRFNTRRAIGATERFLRMAVVHAGGLNTLMFKRLLGRMLTISLEHGEPAALKEFLTALAGAPCRAALYTEFDLNPFVKKNDNDGLCIIGLPHIEIELTPGHLLEFIAFSFGENYLLHFSKNERLAMAGKLLDGPGMLRMAADVMSLFCGRDFDFFIPGKLQLEELGTRTAPAEDDLLAIAKDYGRMLVLLRQRIVMEDPAAYKLEPDFAQWGSQSFFELIRQKHKRSFVRHMHQIALESLVAYGGVVGYTRLKANCERMLLNLPREVVPMPKPIPDYIDSWQKSAERRTYDVTKLVEGIFGGAVRSDEEDSAPTAA